jgi:pyruvate/2-oxoglutarate dehydrogenase complex dihydrolipoamide dehydrogenase (E3) component
LGADSSALDSEQERAKKMERQVDVAVIGAGHASLNAIKEIRKVTDNYVLINGGQLGTTCARFGCMPSCRRSRGNSKMGS